MLAPQAANRIMSLSFDLISCKRDKIKKVEEQALQETRVHQKRKSHVGHQRKKNNIWKNVRMNVLL